MATTEGGPDPAGASRGPAEEAWAALAARMDAAVREDYRDFHDRQYRQLPAGVVEQIEALHAAGTSLADIAELLDRLGQRPLARRDRAWSSFTVRVALAVAADPELRARLVEPGQVHAA